MSSPLADSGWVRSGSSPGLHELQVEVLGKVEGEGFYPGRRVVRSARSRGGWAKPLFTRGPGPTGILPSSRTRHPELPLEERNVNGGR